MFATTATCFLLNLRVETQVRIVITAIVTKLSTGNSIHLDSAFKTFLSQNLLTLFQPFATGYMFQMFLMVQ